MSYFGTHTTVLCSALYDRCEQWPKRAMSVCDKKGHVRQYSRQEGGKESTVQEGVLYMQEVLYTCRMCRRGGEEGRAGERRGGQGRVGQGRGGQGRAGQGATKWRRALLVYIMYCTVWAYESISWPQKFTVQYSCRHAMADSYESG